LTVSEQALDADELAQLYDGHALRAFRYARAMGLSESDADDVVAECFLRILESRAGFRGDAVPGTWLISIVRNTVLNFLRSGRRRDRLHERLESRAVNRENPEEIAAQRECFVALGEAIAGLAPENRSALALVVFAGLPLRDAAQLEGITEPALSSRLYQARKAVRAQLAARQLLES